MRETEKQRLQETVDCGKQGAVENGDACYRCLRETWVRDQEVTGNG